MNEIHKCTNFHRGRREGLWKQSGLFRERDVEVAFVCRDCGRERPGRFRKVIAIEREGSSPQVLASDARLRRLARCLATLSQNRSEIRADGLIRRLGGVQAEAEIERIATLVPLRLIYRPFSGGLRLHSIRVLDRIPLEEIARPGFLARRANVLADARSSVSDLVDPEAVSIRELLASNEAVDLDERIIKALAALARLLETGDVLPAKAFSAQVLGNSKSLSVIRNRLERIVGPLERLGIRDWGGMVLMGGAGVLHLQSTDIKLDSFRCLGVSSDDILALRDLELPLGGVLVVENLTPFQACLGATKRESLGSCALVRRISESWCSATASAGGASESTDSGLVRPRLGWHPYCEIDSWHHIRHSYTGAHELRNRAGICRVDSSFGRKYCKHPPRLGGARGGDARGYVTCDPQQKLMDRTRGAFNQAAPQFLRCRCLILCLNGLRPDIMRENSSEKASGD